MSCDDPQHRSLEADHAFELVVLRDKNVELASRVAELEGPELPYALAMKAIAVLMTQEWQDDSPECRLLKGLAAALEAYEKEVWPL